MTTTHTDFDPVAEHMTESTVGRIAGVMWRQIPTYALASVSNGINDAASLIAAEIDRLTAERDAAQSYARKAAGEIDRLVAEVERLRKALEPVPDYLDELEAELIRSDADMAIPEIDPPSQVADRIRAALQPKEAITDSSVCVFVDLGVEKPAALQPHTDHTS